MWVKDSPKGMMLDVVRGRHDCTLNGISSRHDRLHLIGVLRPTRVRIPVAELPRDMQVFTKRPDDPAVALLVRDIMGRLVASIVPVEQEADGLWFPVPGVMAGGHYAAWSDSRISALVEARLGHPFYGALSIHDRIEGSSRDYDL